MGMMEIICFTN